jgi:hypothetical protein
MVKECYAQEVMMATISAKKLTVLMDRLKLTEVITGSQSVRLALAGWGGELFV